MTGGGVFGNPAIVALLAALPGLLVAYWAYLHSQRADSIAAQAGIATAEKESIGQVIDGLNKIIANLQSDNSTLRQDRPALEECKQQLAALRATMQPAAPS